jgi:hypothetical protein
MNDELDKLKAEVLIALLFLLLMGWIIYLTAKI